MSCKDTLGTISSSNVDTLELFDKIANFTDKVLLILILLLLIAGFLSYRH